MTKDEAIKKLDAMRAELARVNAALLTAKDVDRGGLLSKASSLRAEIATLEMLSKAIDKRPL